MKTNFFLPAALMLVVSLMTGCEKDLSFEEFNEPTALESDNSLLKSVGENSLTAVNLGLAGEFTILSKSGITNVFQSAVTGDVGSSPITGAAILLTCTEVVGTIYSVDAAGPLPCTVTNATRLTTAVGDMQTAYTDAAGRVDPDFLNEGAGNIGGLTLTPGLYKFTSAVIIPTDVTIEGSSNDIWIFQIDGTLNMSSDVMITLTGGAQAKNIFWQTAGAVTLGTNSHFEGIILGQTGINLQTGGSINGRLLAQTAVTLQMNFVTNPVETNSDLQIKKDLKAPLKKAKKEHIKKAKKE